MANAIHTSTMKIRIERIDKSSSPKAAARERARPRS
jgi:hypothetical protein